VQTESVAEKIEPIAAHIWVNKKKSISKLTMASMV